VDYHIHTTRQLAGALRSRRKQKMLTQAEAGVKVGLLPKTVSGLETDPERAMLKSFMQLLSALDMELVLRPKDFRKTRSTQEW
jgi:HTH-type transcriptional regulator/antitoxin HipB